MKPVAYMTKSGVLFKNAPDAPLELTPLYEMPKPLSDEEINEIYLKHKNQCPGLELYLGYRDWETDRKSVV